jgi:hypothetical protein
MKPDSIRLHCLSLLCLSFAFIAGPVVFAQDSVTQLASSRTPAYLNNDNANSPSKPNKLAWPVQCNCGQFAIHSTVAQEKFEAFLPALAGLPIEMRNSLGIAITEEPIHVVVLESREALDQYAQKIMPSAPSRRALYIRHRGPGLVLTYFHPQWINDLRHECTHALLDASKMRLPVWLDEGMAEYFETLDDTPVCHASHLPAVQTQIRYGQVSDLERLEQMDPNTPLTAKDYRDAWSVVALMLNASQETKSVYCNYLQDMQQQRAAGLLSHRIAPKIRSWRDEYNRFFRLNHVEH